MCTQLGEDAELSLPPLPSQASAKSEDFQHWPALTVREMP